MISPQLWALSPASCCHRGLAVESTYNRYWLVDGLMDADYRVHLANPAAIQQYSGLKYSDDHSDARWLGHLLRLGVLPEGYIYPKADRAVRICYANARTSFVSTPPMCSVSKISWCAIPVRVSQCQAASRVDSARAEALLPDAYQVLAITSSLAVLDRLGQQIKTLEKTVSKRLIHTPSYEQLLTVDGIGTILAQTIALETGHIARFPTVGDYASYCRCVDSTKISNGKRKGQGHVKNGHPYLAWAYMEAAQFAIRFSPKAQRFYQRKLAKSNNMTLARKSVAHKWSRACYYIMRDLVPFDASKAFG